MRTVEQFKEEIISAVDDAENKHGAGVQVRIVDIGRAIELPMLAPPDEMSAFGRAVNELRRQGLIVMSADYAYAQKTRQA